MTQTLLIIMDTRGKTLRVPIDSVVSFQDGKDFPEIIVKEGNGEVTERYFRAYRSMTHDYTNPHIFITSFFSKSQKETLYFFEAFYPNKRVIK